jgi:hypothetical protein
MLRRNFVPFILSPPFLPPEGGNGGKPFGGTGGYPGGGYPGGGYPGGGYPGGGKAKLSLGYTRFEQVTSPLSGVRSNQLS